MTLAVGGGLFLSFAWPFFRFITYAGEEKVVDKTPNRKKWFALKHTTINHPRNGYAKEYEESKAWCEAQTMKDMHIRSRDGLKLHASYLPAENAKRFVILCHGYRGTRFGTIAHIADNLHEHQCNLLFIDQRCCGESEGEYITFGAKEQYDVLDWIDRINEENPKHLPIYLYGQSMGAASVLLASGHDLPKEVHGIVADSGFHSMKQQMRDIAAGWFHIKWISLLLLRVDLFCRMFAGFSMKQTDTTEALLKNDRPVLFFHGEQDTYVWPENSKKNYEICRAPKELVMVPGARHICSSFVDEGMYQKKMLRFFAKYDKGSEP